MLNRISTLKKMEEEGEGEKRHPRGDSSSLMMMKKKEEEGERSYPEEKEEKEHHHRAHEPEVETKMIVLL